MNRASIARLAKNLSRGLEDFDTTGFVTCASEGLEALELKARVSHVADAMKRYLPANAHDSIRGILRAVPKWDLGDPDDSLRGFAAWPVFVFVETACADAGEVALRALGQLTHLFTAEFSVRSFIQNTPEMSMAVVSEWAHDSSEQIRRLASEGIRPRLPWATQLPAFIRDPTPIIEVLDILVDDESLYVRRSVANNLSDIAADHPDLVIATCKRWLKKPNAKRRWIAKRATRNLIKSGHPEVWGLHGFTEKPAVAVEMLRLEPSAVSMNENFTLEFNLVSRAKREQHLVVDFVVHHVKAGGNSSPKIFKLCELVLAPGESVRLSKTHAFRTITTRQYYQGPHRVEVQVNGVRHAEAWVELR